MSRLFRYLAAGLLLAVMLLLPGACRSCSPRIKSPPAASAE
jgi:hypothetical protein